MFEKVNPYHPDKVADRIAGAIVDLAYKNTENPKIAVEVLIGHGMCHIIAESSERLNPKYVEDAVIRISEDPDIRIDYMEYPQDSHLAENQKDAIRCGDNGIFCGMPTTKEQEELGLIARVMTSEYESDGKYIFDRDNLVICQSHCEDPMDIVDKLLVNDLGECADVIGTVKINPLGPWTGGINVDTGATNRKLGSDMGDAVTGGGLHGKDLSKADVSVNIYAHLKARELGIPVRISCAIGDETVDGKPYSEIVEIARNYIRERGGFERFAEWGLV